MNNFYSTKLLSRSIHFLFPLGILLILFGISSIILSSIELHYTVSTMINYSLRTISKNKSENEFLKLSYSIIQSQQSIWSILGKGIWFGLLFTSIGIFSLIVYREKTLISIRILCPLAFLILFLSFYLFLSSISVLHFIKNERRYLISQKTSDEQKQILFYYFLCITSILVFILSFILSIRTLIASQFFQRQININEDNH